MTLWLVIALSLGGAVPTVFVNDSSVTTTPNGFIAYIAAFQHTVDIGADALPGCSASSGKFLHLVNERTGKITAAHNLPFTNLSIGWEIGKNATVSPELAGVYHCVSDLGKSQNSYELNIVGKYLALY